MYEAALMSDRIGAIIEAIVVIGVVIGTILSVVGKLRGKIELKELEDYKQRIAEQFKAVKLTGYQQRESFKTVPYTPPAKADAPSPEEDFMTREENPFYGERPWYETVTDDEHNQPIAEAPPMQIVAVERPMKARAAKNAALNPAAQTTSLARIVRGRSLRDMMIAKEILDSPVSRRERKGYGIAR